jgi:hypothetical protein
MSSAPAARFAQFAAAALFLSAAVGLPLALAADNAKSSPIKGIMKEGFKGDDSLFAKVLSGKGSKEDKAKLHAMTVELAKHEAPKGDAKSWHDKVAALNKATQAVSDDAPGGLEALKAAGNCKGCHSGHKPAPPKAGGPK